MELIAQITLLATAALDLIAMLHSDVLTLQSCSHSNSACNKLLKEKGEVYSAKRLLPLAVLIGTCTTMAQMSWIVVMILAAVILAQALYMLWPKRDKSAKMDKRSCNVYCITLALAVLIPALVGYIVPGDRTKCISAASYTVLLEIICSPVLLMLVNWLLPGRKGR